MLSQLFQPDPLFIVQYDTVITFSINSSMMASLKFDQLRQTMLLYDPLAEGYSEEYLLVLTHLQLKVYHMASLKQIF